MDFSLEQMLTEIFLAKQFSPIAAQKSTPTTRLLTQTLTVVCDTGFFGDVDANNDPVCVVAVTCDDTAGQIPDETTNTCVCDAGLFTGTDANGDLACETVLSAEVNPDNQVVNPNTNRCVCDDASTPDVDANGDPICTVTTTTVSCNTDAGQIEDPNNTNECICSPNLFTTTNPADGTLVCLPYALGPCTLTLQVLDDTNNACVCAPNAVILSLNLVNGLVCIAA